MKEIYIIAKFGKGRRIRLREYRFTTRKSAKTFGRVLLAHNPLCTSYTVYGD